MTYLLLCLSIALFSADQESERVTCGRPGQPCQATQGTVQVSATSTFRAQCTLNQQGKLFRNAPVEPYVAVDPLNPRHLVGAWQQDRWSNGGAAGILTAVSTDGGQSWSRSSAAFSTCTGGTIARASDPWVTIAPDGTVYQAALGLTAESPSSTTSVMVSKSSDGGRSWSVPTVLQQDGAGAANDKEMVAADPTDPRFVYVTWDRASAAAQNSALWFSRTTDSGKTWEPSRAIYDPSATGYISCSQIVVLSDRAVVETFDWNPPGTTTYQIESMASHDRGVTWSSPVLVAPDQSIVVVDVKTNGQVRGAGCPYSAVDRRSGAIYLAWTDAGFSGNVTDGIVLSKSTDGGTPGRSHLWSTECRRYRHSCQWSRYRPKAP